MNQSRLAAIIRERSSPMLPGLSEEVPRLAALKGIRCVLFDVYGTMLTCGSGEIGSGDVSMPDGCIEAAINAAGISAGPGCGGRIRSMFENAIQAEHSRLKVNGTAYPEVDIIEIWGAVLESAANEGLLDRVCGSEAAETLAVEYEIRVNPVWPMPNLSLLVDALRGSGIVLGIFSNAQFYTPITLSVFDETRWGAGAFDADVCAWSYMLREAKPSPAIVGFCIKNLSVKYGIAAEEVLCIGNDMLNDIAASSSAGCRTALFAGDGRSLRLRDGDSRCFGVQPDIVVTSLEQVLKCLGAAPMRRP